MGLEDGQHGVLSTVYCKYDGVGIYQSIQPMQEGDEIFALAELVQDIAPQTIVEIGTARGGTLYL